jgi:hypothetical protein
LISAHERSLCHQKLQSLPIYPLDQVRDVFNKPTCPFISSASFKGMRVHEERRRSNATILRGAFLSTDCPKNLSISVAQLCRLRTAYAKAMDIADHTADIGQLTAVQRRTDDVRSTQLEYLRGLPTLDLAFLIDMARQAGLGYHRYFYRPSLDQVDLEKQVMAFKEAVLRHGSTIIVAIVRGNRDDGHYVSSLVEDIRLEVEMWENDASSDLEDGLHMTVVQEMRERFLTVTKHEGNRFRDPNEVFQEGYTCLISAALG